MKWLTQKEVRTAAKKSERAAIACSKKHWRQLATAKESETRKKANSLSYNSPICEEYCALCVRFQNPQLSFKQNCRQCPLRKEKYSLTCCKEYQAASTAFIAWNNRCPLADFATFTKNAKAMYDRICEL